MNYGDANLGGTVNEADFVLLASNCLAQNSQWNAGDFDGDVDFRDFNVLANVFGAGKN